MDEELMQMLQTLSPEEIQQLMGMGSLDEQGAQLDQQMAQAQALRQPSGENYSTATGAIAGGIGDTIRAIGGALQTRKIREQQKALTGKKDAGRSLYANTIAGRNVDMNGLGGLQPATAPQGPGMDPSELALPFGMGTPPPGRYRR